MSIVPLPENLKNSAYDICRPLTSYFFELSPHFKWLLLVFHFNHFHIPFHICIITNRSINSEVKKPYIVSLYCNLLLSFQLTCSGMNAPQYIVNITDTEIFCHICIWPITPHGLQVSPYPVHVSWHILSHTLEKPTWTSLFLSNLPGKMTLLNRSCCLAFPCLHLSRWVLLE